MWLYLYTTSTLKKKKLRKSYAFIDRSIFYTVIDCNVCSETTDASRRKQRIISNTVSYSWSLECYDKTSDSFIFFFWFSLMTFFWWLKDTKDKINYTTDVNPLYVSKKNPMGTQWCTFHNQKALGLLSRPVLYVHMSAECASAHTLWRENTNQNLRGWRTLKYCRYCPNAHLLEYSFGTHQLTGTISSVIKNIYIPTEWPCYARW